MESKPVTAAESAKPDEQSHDGADERELRRLMIAGLSGDGEAHRAFSRA